MNHIEALEILLKVDRDTVIDLNWFDYFLNDTKKLVAMIILSELNSYQEILDKHEGWTIVEFISEYI